MFNFLEPKLLPKITKTPLCTENYEAENLISKVYSDKLRGFIAYPSTKPPVEFEFEFLCKVNIWYIFLNTSVGNQRCSGLEIFAKNGNSQYVSIGRAVYDGQGVIFCNNRRYSKSNPPPSYNSNFAINFFKNGTYKSFLNCSNLKIVIFRTEKSVPCLAAVEVWGIPSKSCSQKTVETINRLYRQDNETINTEVEVESKDNFKIPDEFKDDLTYELMTIPYTLPSGKTIDHTTLEKHIASEKSFGRKPCDPFTGVKFTEGLKPILNVGLKSRIDMFLLENSHRPETFHLKRTLRVEHSVSKKIKKNCSIINNSIFNLEQAGNSSDYHSNGEIDFLIQKARADSNFISFTQPSTDSTDKICVLCKNTVEYLYELPCEHCYCRNCLLDICINFVCVQCKKIFQRSDVKKIYV